ncbi:MAG: hypothetical protein J1F39_05670 [Clostridiales bacterium]|nr:hypothetical protein [Clostridiales bacterium]
MISIIHGPKGTGKTRRIFDAANACCEKATGTVVFIADNGQSLGLNHNIKFINLSEYSVKGEEEFVGFIKGMLAANFDIQAVFIDGISRLIAKPVDELKDVFAAMEKADEKVQFVCTLSTDKLPAYLKKYAAKG